MYHRSFYSLSLKACLVLFFSEFKESAFLGVEAETQVCCFEETAFLHWWREPGAPRLPAGGAQLACSLVVQVCNALVLGNALVLFRVAALTCF